MTDRRDFLKQAAAAAVLPLLPVLPATVVASPRRLPPGWYQLLSPPFKRMIGCCGCIAAGRVIWHAVEYLLQQQAAFPPYRIPYMSTVPDGTPIFRTCCDSCGVRKAHVIRDVPRAGPVRVHYLRAVRTYDAFTEEDGYLLETAGLRRGILENNRHLLANLPQEILAAAIQGLPFRVTDPQTIASLRAQGRFMPRKGSDGEDLG